MKKVFSAVILVTLLTCTLIISFNIKPAKSSPATITVPDDYSTIQQAIDSASDGDTVSVRNGTYHENIVVGKNNLTLVGEDRDTTIVDGSGTGMVIQVNADNVTIMGFTIQNSGNEGLGSGIVLETRIGGCIIRNNRITRNNAGVLFLYSSHDSIIDNNVITYNLGTPVQLVYSNNDSVTGNTIEDNGAGISSYIAANALVDNNVIRRNNGTGITVGYYPAQPSNWIITNNLLTSNDGGIGLTYGGSNFLRNNTMIDNGYNLYVGGQPPNDYIQDIDTSNTVDGKPVYYLVDQHEVRVPSEAGYVAIVNSSNITLKDANLTKNGQGILLVCTEDTVIESVNVLDNAFLGIYLWNCTNVTIRNSTITDVESGILVEGSSYDVIENNVIAENREGIALSYQISWPNTYNADHNILSENTLIHNEWGVRFYEANDNLVYHNNFINNTIQLESESSTNLLDNGYPSGGNYWSGHNGTDLFSGPFQNETGSDGIRDTPYVIDANNADRYPLTQPYVPLPGDINLDRTVDISDAIMAASTFGSYPGHPSWNSQADLNHDNIVDIFDIIILANNFGKQ